MQSTNTDILFFRNADFVVIDIVGKDRVGFLHALISQDIQKLSHGDFAWGCLLNAKSRLLAFLGIVPSADRLHVFVLKACVDEIQRILETYMIVQDVRLERQDTLPVFMGFDIEQQLVFLTTDTPAQEAAGALFESTRLSLGFPLWGVDFDQPIPLEVGFFHQGISMTKGCYVGQETIARLHARGMNLGKKLIHFEIHQNVSPQSIISFGDQEVGQVSSIAPYQNMFRGLAWIKREGFNAPLSIKGHEATQLTYAFEHQGVT